MSDVGLQITGKTGGEGDSRGRFRAGPVRQSPGGWAARPAVSKFRMFNFPSRDGDMAVTATNHGGDEV
jgi:hypothetical protein